MVDEDNISEFRTITGIETDDLTVDAGWQVNLLGTARGDVKVLAGARFYLGGVQAGALLVDEGGEAVVRGRLDGGIGRNDGVIVVAEGAFIGHLVMGSKGLEQPQSGATYTVTNDTPTHRIRGTGHSLTFD